MPLSPPGGASTEIRPRGRLSDPGGAFVTIREDGELRGCIGYVDSPLPIWRVVEEIAEKAAFEDPRFIPLKPEEFPRISIEVSVLSPLTRMKAPEEIVVGEHGLIVECGERRGLLLPQVAQEHGWNSGEFLQHVCRKAGLEPDAWTGRGATIYLFSADVVEEAHHA
jgi:AmmeMemoRadiSam system protein A